MQLNDQGLIPTLNRILSAAVAAELAQDQEADESCLPVTGREMGLLETVFLSIITSHFGIGDKKIQKPRPAWSHSSVEYYWPDFLPISIISDLPLAWSSHLLLLSEH